MKTIITIILSLVGLSLLTLLSACGRQECKNTNPVFDHSSPETNEYKNELVRQLNRVDNSKLTYWFDRYQEVNNESYLHVFIEGEGLCAKGVVLVKAWDTKLEGIRKTKGLGYSGAELKSLKLSTYQDSASTELIYEGLEAIVD